MNFFKNSKIRRILGGKGLYITLTTCLIAIGGAGVAAYNKAVTGINEGITFSLPDSSVTVSEQQADNKKSDVALDAESSSAKSDTESVVLSTQPNVMPVNGETVNPYSYGELVKSKTLNIWKTHDGVDIAADEGTPVKSMNRGEVIEIREDPLWGNCIVIDHGDGIVGYYYNLSAAITVEEGDAVESGQIIGAVGDSAEIEAAEVSHLHFALKRNGEWTDPIDYINPNSNK